ncbi:MAG: hypothetical protein ACRDYX_20545 [Egibacteraceae bacterium]
MWAEPTPAVGLWPCVPAVFADDPDADTYDELLVSGVVGPAS